MTSPDLRTLAADAILAADPLDDLYSDDREVYLNWADAVLAAVLPEHRRMVLGEAAEELTPLIEWQRRHYGDDAAMRDRVDWIARGRLFGMEDAQATLRRLAAAAPPDGLSAPVPAETAPAVPEEADGQRAGEGGFRLKRRTDAERADYLTQKLIEFMAERDEARADRDRLARELSEAQTELALVKSRPLFSTRKVMQTLLEALGDPVDEQELILRIDDGLRLADVAQRVIAALALTAAERDVVEAAKAWRGNRYASASILELAAAVDALSDAGTDQTEDGHG